MHSRRPVISFATWRSAVKVLHCIDHPSRDIHLWDIRPCRDATWGRAANADRPSGHIPPRSFEPASLMLLLLHTEDDTSPQRLPHCLFLHVNHASSERADAPSSGLFNSTPVHISLFFKPAKAPDRNPHLVWRKTPGIFTVGNLRPGSDSAELYHALRFIYYIML